jgi:hypothetical protein
MAYLRKTLTNVIMCLKEQMRLGQFSHELTDSEDIFFINSSRGAPNISRIRFN